MPSTAAHHDPLTGLPHRALFHDRLDVALANARRSGSHVGVMFLDLDRFKTINDSLGHSVGNNLLQRVADRLRLCVRETDTVARMGGDEFTVLLPTVNGEADCVAVAEKIIQAFAEPFRISARELVTSTSIGIAVFPDSGPDADALVKNADIAMYRAKANGRNTYQTYTHDMSARARVKHSLESSLRRALENDALELHYQPKIDARTNEIVGLEALARWPHAELGYVSPTAFIPLAEETGLIVPLGEWVLDAACGQIQRWSTDHGLRIPVAVNLSAREFTQRRIDTRVADALERYSLAPDTLELEITESIFMQDLDAASAALFNLRDMGVRCSIDDFGTGYSGLTYLSQLPIYSLKIDQSFIRQIGTSMTGDYIVNAVITLARSLRMNVIAEGVETDIQARFLQSRGCEQMQGNLFSPPLGLTALHELFAADEANFGIDLSGEPASVPEIHLPSDQIAAFLHAVCTNEGIGEIDEDRVAGVLASLQASGLVATRRARHGTSPGSTRPAAVGGACARRSDRPTLEVGGA